MESDAFQTRQADLAKGKKILVAPLNWGMGHATRCIPLINEALRQGAEVTLASDGAALQLLKKEFPQLTALELPPYNIRYFSSSMIVNLGAQCYKIPLAVWKERRFLKGYLKNNSLDAIISDNRYGIYDKKIKSVIITHQLRIRASPRGLQWLINAVNLFYIGRFCQCWVPDEAGEPNLSGELSHGLFAGVSIRYIGILSRMIRYPVIKKYDLGVVLSGPEPQRERLEKMVLRQLKELKNPDATYLVVRGVAAEESNWIESGNIEIHNFLTSKELNDKMLACDVVLCRPGYSGIMDLALLDKKAVLIPTPGQTEQEYLAARFKAANVFYSQSQSSLNIVQALAEACKYNGLLWPAEGKKLAPQTINSLFGDSKP